MKLRTLVRQALQEDLGTGDITTDAFAQRMQQATGRMAAKADCVISGMEAATEVFRTVDRDISLRMLAADGDHVNAGDAILIAEGPTASLLAAERTALNFVQRLSGIATLTAAFAGKLRHAKVYDTRKTTPLLRALEKKAVRDGGGMNHRMGLHDAILLKDNHVAMSGSVTAALRAARAAHPLLRREIEVRNPPELHEALREKTEILLLDNMSPAEIVACLERIAASGYSPEVEVSGGITLETIQSYDLPGVHRISVGALTHSPQAADIHFKIKPL